MNQNLKLVLFGLAVMAYIGAFGFIFLFTTMGLAQYYKVMHIDYTQTPYNLVVPAIPIIGLIVMIVWILNFARTKRCPKCKEVLPL